MVEVIDQIHYLEAVIREIIVCFVIKTIGFHQVSGLFGQFFYIKYGHFNPFPDILRKKGFAAFGDIPQGKDPDPVYK